MLIRSEKKASPINQFMDLLSQTFAHPSCHPEAQLRGQSETSSDLSSVQQHSKGCGNHWRKLVDLEFRRGKEASSGSSLWPSAMLPGTGGPLSHPKKKTVLIAACESCRS